MSSSEQYKLADYFAVIGLDEDLQPLENNNSNNLSSALDGQMVEKLEIVVMPDPSQSTVQYNPQVEKWVDLDGTNQIFLRVIYGNQRPITDINFYRIQTNLKDPGKLQIPAKMCIDPVPIKIYGTDPEQEKLLFKKTKKTFPGDPDKDMFYFYGKYDLTPYLENTTGASGTGGATTNLCFGYKRAKTNLPIEDIEIVQGVPGLHGGPDDIEFNLSHNLKQINYRLGKGLKNRLLCFKQRQFLKKHFKAKVLDRYPPLGHDRSYYEFPGDCLSQFCFPSGIKFTQERGVPTHFGFILTEGQGHHIYGTALIFDETLSQEMKHILKKRGHVYNVNLDSIYSQKAICILSHYAFVDQFKEVLKQIYRIHLSHTPIPIERYIVNVMEEIPVPDKQGQIAVLHDIGNQPIQFYRAIDQYPPYATRSDIEYLFRALNAEQVIDIYLALLLEKKVLLISKYKSLLMHAAVSLISFLFPLCWKHVLIPILPKNMIDVIEAPFPYLIGIDPLMLKDQESFEIPNEVFRVDLDSGFISLRDAKPKLPSKEFKLLKQRLMKATEGIERPHPDLELVEQAFNVVQLDYNDAGSDSEGDGDERVRPFRFDEYEIRDAFLEFMSSIMSGYTKYLNAPDSTKDIFLDSRDFFDFKKFRLAKDATKNTTLIYKITETTLFANFIEARSFGKSDQDEQIMFFDDIQKFKRTKKQPQLVGPFKEQKTVKTMTPSEEHLEMDDVTRQPRIFKYQTFPKFDLSQYYKPRTIENYNNDEAAGMHLKSLINNDQLSKMNDQEWARYLAEIIYILWFQIFTTTLPMYQNYSKDLVIFCKRLLHHLNKKLTPMRDIEVIYRRLFEACGTCRLQDEILDLYNDMKNNKIDPDKVTFGTYYQAFKVSKKPMVSPGATTNANCPFQGSETARQIQQQQYEQQTMMDKKESYLKYTPEDFQKKLQEFEFQQQQEEEKVNYFKAPLINNRLSGGSHDRHGGIGSDCGQTDNIETQDESNRVSFVKLSQILENSLFMEFEPLCQQCDKALKEEEILSSFSKNLSAYVIKCPICQENFVPKFKVYSEHKNDFLKGRDGISIQLLSPVTLYKEYVNIVEQKGEQVVLKDTFLKEHRTVFWNIVLYFKIMRLPLFMLDLDYSQLHIKVHVSQIKKYLPLEKKQASILSLAQIPKQPVQASSRATDSSPARKSSISRLTANVLDTFLGSNSKQQQHHHPASQVGAPTQTRGSFTRQNSGLFVNNNNNEGSDNGAAGELRKGQSMKDIPDPTKKSIFKRPSSSHKSGGSQGGPASYVTSLSDLERIEKIMNQAQYASKSIVKYFSKHLEEFRREQSYAKEIILSDIISQQDNIPEAMNKYIQNTGVTHTSNPLTKNFSEWTKNTQQVTADAIINNSGSGVDQLGKQYSQTASLRPSLGSLTGGSGSGHAAGGHPNTQEHYAQPFITSPPPIPPNKKQGTFSQSIFSVLSFGGGGGRSESSNRKSSEAQKQEQTPKNTQQKPQTPVSSSKPPTSQIATSSSGGGGGLRVPVHHQLHATPVAVSSSAQASVLGQVSSSAQMSSQQQQQTAKNEEVKTSPAPASSILPRWGSFLKK